MSEPTLPRQIRALANGHTPVGVANMYPLCRVKLLVVADKVEALKDGAVCAEVQAQCEALETALRKAVDFVDSMGYRPSFGSDPLFDIVDSDLRAALDERGGHCGVGIKPKEGE